MYIAVILFPFQHTSIPNANRKSENTFDKFPDQREGWKNLLTVVGVSYRRIFRTQNEHYLGYGQSATKAGQYLVIAYVYIVINSCKESSGCGFKNIHTRLYDVSRSEDRN